VEETTWGEERKQPIKSGLLKEEVKYLHHRIEEKGGEGIPLTQSTPVVDQVTFTRTLVEKPC
jgi:hypothetical protein